MSHRIEKAYILIAIDPQTGDEAVPAITHFNENGNGVTLPMIGTDPARLEWLMKVGQDFANQYGRSIEIIQLTHREKIGEIHPHGTTQTPLHGKH